jgi:carboxypeptidase Taq
MFGYFPTYMLGNIFAAQILARAAEDLGDLDTHFARGEFLPLRDWLRQHVYRDGSRRRATELIEHVTGNPPDHWPLVRALARKYGDLYGVGS